MYRDADEWLDSAERVAALKEVEEAVGDARSARFTIELMPNQGRMLGRRLDRPTEPATDHLSDAAVAARGLAHEAEWRHRARDRVEGYLCEPNAAHSEERHV